MTVIDNPEALATFRRGLTGQDALGLLGPAGGRLLITLPVGVGKTGWIINIIQHIYATQTSYDAVLLLVPREDILEEILRRLPDSIDPTVLRARPRERCADLNSKWLDLEENRCAQLGRVELCGGCPMRKGCDWLMQYGNGLRGVRLVLATQKHLVLDPNFVARMKNRIGATRMLTLADESGFLLEDRRCTITAQELSRFRDVQRELSTDPKLRGAARTWIQFIEDLTSTNENDLKSRRWHDPDAPRGWTLATQRTGRRLFGPGFRYIGFDLTALCSSDSRSRRVQNGTISFASPVRLGNDFIVFSGTVASRLVSYRIDPNSAYSRVQSPFADHRFTHPDTRFINLKWTGGAARNFLGNAPQILDFYAEKIARNIRAGRRTLLIARKSLLPVCAAGLHTRLAQLGLPNARVVTGDWDLHDLTDPAILPLINYGVSGINRFEDFEAAYCLTGFYVNPQAIESSLQDLDPIEGGWGVTIRTDDTGCRSVTLSNPAARSTLLPRLAQDILNQLEADVIVQAVGRVRPFTRPREIITFHCGKLPSLEFHTEFESLDRARAYFEILSRREAEHGRLEVRVAYAQRRNDQGATLQQIATELGVKRRTVSRYLPNRASHNP